VKQRGTARLASAIRGLSFGGTSSNRTSETLNVSRSSRPAVCSASPIRSARVRRPFMKNARLILVVRGIGAEQLPPIDGIYRSREFIEFLKLINAAYPAHTAIRLILGNHSAHISKETKTWLADQPVGRFEFTFTPKHGSWLNLVEGFFSKLGRSVLPHPRRVQTGT
jgi:hypothetical protein